MEHILSPSNRGIIAQMAWANVLLAFDFDGTLAPIVRDPARASLPRTTRLLLEGLARRYPCAIISGRARDDVLQRVRGIKVWSVVGSHGLDPSWRHGRYLRDVRRWRQRLCRRLGGVQGVLIEDKAYSLAIHYRRSRRKRDARAAIAEAVAGLRGPRLIWGKEVLNLVPRDAPHKGMALERLRSALGCDTALYLGDDETDEDVFTLDQPGRLLGIRVGRSRRSAASYFLRSQLEVPGLLRALVKLRPAVEDQWRMKP